MRSLHQRGSDTKKVPFLSSFRLCLSGWGSFSLEILQVCSCAEPGSLQLGTHVDERCRRGFLEVDRVKVDNLCETLSKVDSECKTLSKVDSLFKTVSKVYINVKHFPKLTVSVKHF